MCGEYAGINTEGRTQHIFLSVKRELELKSQILTEGEIDEGNTERK